MKLLRLPNWAYLLCSAPLWLACSSTATEEKASGALLKPEAAGVTGATQAEVVAQRVSPIIKGAWVKADYLAAVQKSKSPLMAFDLAGPVSEMIINPAERTVDSLVVGLGLGNHEGGNMTVYFRSGSRPNALPTSFKDYESAGSFAELSYKVAAADTALLLTTYGKTGKVLARASYQRVRGASLAELEALNRAVRHLVLVGKYTGTDSLGRAVRMEFTDNGQLKGLKGFKTYDVQTDFLSDTIDYLTLDSGTKHSRRMAFRRQADALRLYAAHEEDNPVPTVVRDRLLFTLVRR